MSIRKSFCYHRPGEAAVPKLAAVRQAFSDLADFVEEVTGGLHPECPHAIKALREAMMWTTAGIVLHDPGSAVDPDSWPKTNGPFKPGDVVRPRQGGPAVTVLAVAGDKVTGVRGDGSGGIVPPGFVCVTGAGVIGETGHADPFARKVVSVVGLVAVPKDDDKPDNEAGTERTTGPALRPFRVGRKVTIDGGNGTVFVVSADPAPDGLVPVRFFGVPGGALMLVPVGSVRKVEE